MVFTKEVLKALTYNELVVVIEEYLGPLDIETKLRLAILHGAGEKGVTVYSGPDMTSVQRSQESLDYDKLAELLNNAPPKNN